MRWWHRQGVFYEIDKNGKIARTYRIRNIEELSGVDQFEILDFAGSPEDDSLVGIDSRTNATLFRLKKDV